MTDNQTPPAAAAPPAPVADAATASIWSTARYDVPAGLVVFLVALPLCLGIALACETPLMSGIVAGVIGGLLVPLISRSALSVCGPAAGLTAIVLAGVTTLGSFEAFLFATIIAGAMQIVLGLLRGGVVVGLVPAAVIKGMLAAIGIILIIKQIPHAFGYDASDLGLEETGMASYMRLFEMLGGIRPGAVIISALSLAILFLWPKTPFAKIPVLPGALIVVVVGTLLNLLFGVVSPGFALEQSHLVTLPTLAGPLDFFANLARPDFSVWDNSALYSVALTLAVVASIETLLSIEAVDRIDPWKRQTPTSRELIAQGVANMASGVVGGLPITSVIVRSSANVSSGARNRLSALTHGVLLFVAVLFVSQVLNFIPLACLAAILLQTGYKLAQPQLMKAMYRLGWDQFLPFALTVAAILVTDLLKGVALGLVLGVVFSLRANVRGTIQARRDGDRLHIKMHKDATFLVKPALRKALADVKAGDVVTIDATDEFVDYDIRDALASFQDDARSRGITVELIGVDLAGPIVAAH